MQVVFIGMGVGSSYWGWLADNFGRKTVSYRETLEFNSTLLFLLSGNVITIYISNFMNI